MSLQLQVIPDEWTGLPAFVPGECPWEQLAAGTMHARLNTSQIAMTASAVQELSAYLKRLMWLGLIDANGNPVPATPAGTDAYGNVYFHHGGLVVLPNS